MFRLIYGEINFPKKYYPSLLSLSNINIPLPINESYLLMFGVMQTKQFVDTVNTETVSLLRLRAMIGIFVLSLFLYKRIVFPIPIVCCFPRTRMCVVVCFSSCTHTQPPSIYPIKRREEYSATFGSAA